MSVALCETARYCPQDYLSPVDMSQISDLKHAFETGGFEPAFEGVYSLGRRNAERNLVSSGFSLLDPVALRYPVSFEQLGDKVGARDEMGRPIPKDTCPPNKWLATVFADPELNGMLSEWNAGSTVAAAMITGLDGRTNWRAGQLNDPSYQAEMLGSEFLNGERLGISVVEVLEGDALETVPASFFRTLRDRGIRFSTDDFCRGEKECNYSHKNAKYMAQISKEIEADTGEPLKLEIKVNPLDICIHAGKPSLREAVSDILKQMAPFNPYRVVWEGMRYQSDIKIILEECAKYEEIQEVDGQSRDWKFETSVELGFNDRIYLEDLPARLTHADNRPVGEDKTQLLPCVHDGSFVGLPASLAAHFDRLTNDRIDPYMKSARRPLLPEMQTLRHAQYTRIKAEALRNIIREVKDNEWVLDHDPSIAPPPSGTRHTLYTNEKD